MTLDASGNLYFADYCNMRVRKVDAATGIITTLAGTGVAGFNGDSQPATSAQLYYPAGVALDASGNLYIAEYFNHRVRKVDAATGIITTVAGTGISGWNGDNQPATSAQLSGPVGVAVDASGNLYIADRGNELIRKVNTAGIITTVAFSPSEDVAVDASGNVYIADYPGHLVLKMDATTGTISTVAGTGVAGFNGDNQPATSAQLNGPTGLAVDASGNLYIVDYNDSRVRRVDAATGIITAVAGTGDAGFNGDNQPATSAQLNLPVGVAVNASGNVYITDAFNARIRKVAIPQPFTFVGFLRPVDNPPIINEAKAGKTIPVKWQLSDASGNFVSDLSSFVSLLSAPMACDASPSSIVAEQLSSPGSTVFRYDSTTNQFIFNWQTASSWQGCRLLQLTLSDGTKHYAKFNFK